MDFSFTEAQSELAGLARQVFGDRVTVETLRAAEERGARFDRDLWHVLGETGLLGAALPEDVGGAGGGVIELCLVLVEAGRRLAPVPLVPTLAMAALPIAAFGTEAQRRRLLPGVVEGRTVLTAALSEPRSQAAAPPVRAERAAEGFRLSGSASLVPAATVADLALVPAELEGSRAVFVVELGTRGLTVVPQRTSGRDAAGILELDQVPLPPDALLGEPGGGEAVVAFARQRAAVALAALQLGVLEEALRETAAYTTERVQFDRPIATFQAVGHRCADCYIDVEGVRLTLWQAAWRLDAGLPAEAEVEVAKFWAAEAGHRVAHAAVHLHGGMGVATEHVTHRYFLAAKELEFLLGGATEQLLSIGRRLAATPA